jgi:integrase
MSQNPGPGLAVPPAQNITGAGLSDAALAAVAAGMPASTRRAYTDNLRWYLRWCADRGVRGLPASAATLTEYAAWGAYAMGWAPVTIERARWAIIKWHKLAGAPPPATDGLVLVLKGYKDHLARTHDPKAAPRKADAAAGDIITSMVSPIDTGTLAGKRDKALILIGFGIAGRRSEIAGVNIEDIRFEGRGMQVSVYRQKTKLMDAPVIHRRPGSPLCAVRAAEELVTALGRTSGPLFVRINRHGQPAHPMTRDGQPIGDPSGRLTGQAVAEVIRRHAVTAGLPGRFTGHSLRRGSATALHRAGVSRELIERQGGWSPGSRVVAGYIEEEERWLSDVFEGVL